MKNFKHLLTALLLLCATVATAHDFEVDGIYYNISSSANKAVEVTCKGPDCYYYSNEYTGNVVIPESVTYNGATYSVTSIGSSAFYNCSGLTSIEIPNSVTSIGSSAFYNCSGLTSIEIPNSVTSIGNHAFYDCDGLTSIEIPNSVTNIGGFAFWDCTGLTSIEIPNSVTSIGSHAFWYCTGLTSIVIPNSVTSIESSAFCCCTGLTSIVVDDYNTKYDSRENCNAIIETETNTLILGCKNSVIPNNVTSIGEGAFGDCTGLTSIEIPNSVTNIGECAFERCSGLTSIVIPNSVTSIGEDAFWYCTGLTSIVIGNSVTSIGEDAFNGCKGLTSIVVDDYNTKYDSRENCNAIIETETNTLILGCKNSVIPNKVTSIGENAFYGCYGLTSIVIPNSVTSIGSSAFYNCTGLTGIVIPNSVTSIGEDAFYCCYGLTSIVIPNSVTSIGNGAFRGCSGLTSVVIPNSVTSVGEDAFNGCDGLTSIVIPNSVTSIGEWAFYSCDGLTSIVIPNSVTSIGKYAFCHCDGLTSVVIGNSVTSIGDEAFYSCDGLTSIVIPNSVTNIGDEAFYDCSELKTVINVSNLTFSKGSSDNGYVAYYADEVYNARDVSMVGDFIFGKPNDVNTLLYYLGNATELTLPADYNGENYVIGNDAFNGCTGLASVVIPGSVTSIGERAFSNCTGLKTVFNFSNFTFSKGSTGYGYVAYYADKIYNAPNGSMVGDFIFGKPNDVNTLLYYLGNATELTLPTDYNSENYKIGADVFKDNTTITSVVIPGCVTSIGNYAFNGCTSLKELRIVDGESTLSLGYNTYNGSDTGKGLFYDCPLRVLYLGRNLSYDAGRLCGYSPFNNMKTLTSVNIGNSVTSIGRNTLYGCSGLASITIPNSVTSIGDYAFNGCTGLKTIFNFSNFTFSKGSTGYGYVAYYADKVYNAPNGSFEGDFIFGKPNDVNTLLYYLGNATELTLPADYKEESYVIGSAVFKGKSAITSIEIPSTVTSIGSSAFYNCTGLTGIEIPSSVTSIGSSAFNGCSGLTSITIPNSVTIVENAAFSGCTGLTSVEIPNSVTSVGDDAFAGCSNVERLDLDCAEVGNWFCGVSVLKEVAVGSGVTSVLPSAFNGCTGLEKVCISDLAAWCSIDFGNEKANPLCYAKNLYLNGNLLTDVIIPGVVTEIKDYAFYNCAELINITLPDGVKTIGQSAFNGCGSVETLYISSTIESIGDYAFAGCNNLFEIKIGSKKAITASENVFSNDAYNNACLFVPAGRKFAYEKTTPWNNFYIVEMDFTGIDEVNGENGMLDGVYYDLNGRAVENQTNGIYIRNGKKVLVK